MKGKIFNEVLMSWKRCGEKENLNSRVSPECLSHSMTAEVINGSGLLTEVFDTCVKCMNTYQQSVFFY